jgi:hypothetical protein
MAQRSAGRFDDLAHLVRHVGWQIVDDHDVTRPQRWCQALQPCVVLLAASSSRAFRGSLRRLKVRFLALRRRGNLR